MFAPGIKMPRSNRTHQVCILLGRRDNLLYSTQSALTEYTRTSWCEPVAPNSFRVQCSRRFLELDPEIWHTSSMSRSRAIDACGLLFDVPFRHVFFFSFFGGIFESEDILFFAGKKTKRTFVKGLAGAHGTRVCTKFQGLSKKTA